MTTPDAGDDSDLYELAPEEPAKPVKRWVSPQQATQDAKPLPCPRCRYDLRGLRADRCPECGLQLTSRARRDAQSLREGARAGSWLDRKAIIMAMIGLAVSAGVWYWRAGATGLAIFGIDFGLTVVLGWVVFFACSVLWIGFDQPLRTTLVQTVGAFGFFAGLMAVLDLIPMPGLIAMVLGFLILAGLLSDMLDIDFQDAAIIAVGVSLVKIGIGIAVIAGLLS